MKNEEYCFRTEMIYIKQKEGSLLSVAAKFQDSHRNEISTSGPIKY